MSTSQVNLGADGAAPSPYPAIGALLARRKLIVNGSAAAMFALGIWLGWRTGLPELYLVGAVLAAALHFVMRVAIEVVGLVAETLMPQ